MLQNLPFLLLLLLLLLCSGETEDAYLPVDTPMTAHMQAT